jgi:hypothetical protein
MKKYVCLFVLLMLTAALGADDKFWVKASPQTLFAGRDTRVVCHVPRDDNNRGVELGVANFRSSWREMHGANELMTFDFPVQRVPCGAGPAFCRVSDAYNQQREEHVPLTIAGCEDPSGTR